MSDFNFQGETEQSMVAALRLGRQETLAKLYDAYAPVMMGVITRIVADRDVAEEVLQETFVAIWTRIGLYDASKHRLLTWGLAIARGIALEAIRTNRYKPGGHAGKSESETGIGVDKNVISEQEIKKKPDICSLKPLERTAMELLYLKGRTFAETAAEMNMAAEELKEIIKRAFTHLKAGKSA